MRSSLIQAINQYKQWRKGVLLFTLIELAIVAAIILLLVILLLPRIIKMKKDSECSTALINLKRYLDELNLRLADTSVTVDANAEKKKLEEMLEAVKKSCVEDSSVQNDGELKSKMEQLYRTLNGITESKGEEEKPIWQSFLDVAKSFRDKYFPSQGN